MEITEQELKNKKYGTVDEILFRKKFYLTPYEDYTLTLRKDKDAWDVDVYSGSSPDSMTVENPFSLHKRIVMLYQLDEIEKLIEERIEILALKAKAHRNTTA